ncbi:ATP-binding protein [Planctobacterium marinum]|uniref:ATP-binding protein n=1 Tax=Planctobacterium marinum TaxID=1631968 RepID=UPI001E343245|nr:ATP-binding protein [Planctobacterium marinum]MCC2607819.1 HAMP domain-containing protein [Planctobacterium marinum]
MNSRYLNKLNPLNSIFGRLFLWFWLTTVVMIVCTAITVRQIIKGPELQTIPADEQQKLEQIAIEFRRKVEAGVFHNSRKMSRLVRMLSTRFDSDVVILDVEQDRVFHDAPRMPAPFERRFINLASAETAYGFMAADRLFFGPVNVEVAGKQYSIFNGRMIRFPMLQHRTDLFALIALSISGLLCFALAWSFTRPIKELRDATQEMAKGNLQAGTTHNTSRKDEIGELSHDFQTMSVKLNELLENQKRLLADISHELRSPLARLQLAIGIAQQNLETQPSSETTENNPIHLQLLERIEKEAHQIDTMIGNVLQLSRLESKAFEVHKHKECFPGCIEGIIDDARYEAKSHGKSIDTDFPEPFSLFVESTLLGSAVENILRNSIKYAQQRITISASVDQQQLIIRISDDGCGVPQQELSKLFTPFYRVSFARNRESGGTGLGLAIATQAINAHNGSIKATNNDKGGLSVAISIPIQES